MKKRNEIVLFLLIGTLIMFNISQHSNIRSLENQISNIVNEVRSVSYRINDLNNSINQVVQKNKLIHNYKIDIEKLDEEYKDANVSINVVFNELSIDSKVYFVFRERAIYNEDYYNEIEKPKLIHEEGKWQKVEMYSIDNIEYNGVFRGSYEHDYDIHVLVEDNGVNKIELIPKVDLYNKLRSRLNIIVRPKSWDSNGKIEYHVNLIENVLDEKIKLISAESTLFYNEKVIEKVDILKEDNNNMIEEPKINIWDFTRLVNVEVTDNEESKNDSFRIEVIVEDSLGNIYSKSWRENLH